MRRFAFHSLLALLGALVVLGGLPGTSPRSATADETTCLSRLTSDELATLKRRVPKWDELEASKRERIACAVLRMRGLSSEDRARLRERGELFRGRSGGPSPALRRREGGGDQPHAAVMAVAQGVLRVVMSEMPKETTRAFRQARIQRARTEAAFLRRMFESEVKRLGPKAHEISVEDMPRWMRRRLSEAQARLATKDDPNTRKRIAMAVLMVSVGKLVSAQPEKPQPPQAKESLTPEARKAFHKERTAWYEALGAAAKAAWPEAYAEAKADFLARTSDLDAMKAWVERFGVQPHEARAGAQRLMILARLESWAARLKKRDDGVALGHVHGLMAACLRELGRSERDIQAFQNATDAERKLLLKTLLKELSEASGGMGKPGGPRRGERRRRGGAGRPGQADGEGRGPRDRRRPRDGEGEAEREDGVPEERAPGGGRR